MNTSDTFEGFKIPKNAKNYKKEIRDCLKARTADCCVHCIDNITCRGIKCYNCIMFKYPNNRGVLEKWLSIETPITENTQITTTTRTLSYVVHPSDKSIFDESATVVKIEDEGAGEFIEITQCPDTGSQSVRINPEEWNAIKNAVEKLLESID